MRLAAVALALSACAAKPTSVVAPVDQPGYTYAMPDDEAVEQGAVAELCSVVQETRAILSAVDAAVPPLPEECR